MTGEYQAAEVFPPGEFIREELEAREWTQADLAEIIDSTPRHVSELVSGKRAVTPETARKLAEAFGNSAELWLGLESDYQLYLSRAKVEDGRIADRASLYSRAPIAEMARRGWIEKSSDVDYLGRQVKAFLGVNSLSEKSNLGGVAARAKHPFTSAQEVWFRRARQLATAVDAGPFSQKRLNAALPRLRGLVPDPENVRHVPKILADAGIRFVVIEHTKGSRIDGAAFWIGRKPLIALSMRYDKLDSFWHTLMHEVGHIYYKHTSDLDVNLVGPDADPSARSDADAEADAFAQEFLLPEAVLDRFIARNDPLYSKAKVLAFAAVQQVHPSIVLGQLKHRGRVRWQNLAGMHPRVRGVVTESALCDGWGQELPIWRLEP